jgi:hypothetical protein
MQTLNERTDPRPRRPPPSVEDWLAFFSERADVAEFDGHLPRSQAEARAFACCLAEWQDRNPVRSPPGRCLGCGRDDHDRALGPIVPFGTESTGHAWLHSRCWPAWHAGRRAGAAAALAGMGISASNSSGKKGEVP